MTKSFWDPVCRFLMTTKNTNYIFYSSGFSQLFVHQFSFSALCNLMPPSYGLQCYTNTNASNGFQPADTTLEVCESDRSNCLAVVSKEELRKLNPQIARETVVEGSRSLSLGNVTVLVTPNIIDHQG